MGTTSTAVPRLRPGEPPRHVTTALRLRILLSPGVQTICFILLFVTPFFWMFAMRADVSGPLFWGRTVVVTGTVLDVRPANVSINKSPVESYHYRFEREGRVHEGVSFGDRGLARPGSTVQIELAGSPTMSRMVDTRRGALPVFALLVGVIPGLLLYALARELHSTLGWLRLLKDGQCGVARLVSRKIDRTNTNKKNTVPFYNFVFAFEDERRRTREHSFQASDTSRFGDEVEEPLLYLRGGRGPVALLDELPGHPRVQPDGSITHEARSPIVLLFLLPGALVTANVIAALLHFDVL